MREGDSQMARWKQNINLLDVETEFLLASRHGPLKIRQD